MNAYSADATPAEIDTEIARLTSAMDQQNTIMEQANALINKLTENPNLTAYYRSVDQIRSELGGAQRLYRLLFEQRAPLLGEYDRRGGWTRYYLVDNTNGHVHSSTACSTCYVDTRYLWLTSESGRTAEDVVADAKAQACTVCFPWAPVTSITGKYRTTSQQGVDARAAERAAKAAEKAAKAITNPDGSALRDADYGTVIKTETAARNALLSNGLDLAWYGPDHPTAAKWAVTIRRCVLALAAKRGVSVADVVTEFDVKLAKKITKEGAEHLVSLAAIM